MNTNPDAKVVLCFGDSHTWGQKPDKSGRQPANIRWTGQLQQSLGNDYYIIEEGLGGRTTDLEYDRKPGRNGKTYLQPCLESHNPTDVVIIMLGSNDLKIEYSRSVQDIAHALKDLVAVVREYGKKKVGGTPDIVLVSPIFTDDTAPRFSEFYSNYYDHGSAVKSTELATAIEQIAIEVKVQFVDASTVARAGEDGLHFSLESHAALAKLLSDKLEVRNSRL